MKKSIIDIAIDLLLEKDSPIPSSVIAEEALNRNLIVSNAKNPKQSLANTIDKMIREKTTDRLIHRTFNNQKYVALPEWDSTKNVAYSQCKYDYKILVDNTIKKLLNLLVSAELVDNETGALKYLIDNGKEKTINVLIEEINKLSSI